MLRDPAAAARWALAEGQRWREQQGDGGGGERGERERAWASLDKLPGEAVRALAAFKGIEASEAGELTAAAITQAASRVTTGTTRREERQAVLDVLDGLCLLLLDDVLRALRAMARLTAKVHRPRLHGLASYFGARSKADEEPEEPPTPAPTPA